MESEQILELLKQTAAEVITPRFRALAEGDIDQKSPGDYVTVADREAEAHLTRLLHQVYPAAVVVGEETAFLDPAILKRVPNAEHAFVIDPIDGTGNFVRGKDEHGVILAELRAGVTTRGWIWQPQTGRAYVVERGAGVRMNGEKIVRQRHDRLPLGASSKKKLLGFTADGRLSPVVRSSFAACFDYPMLLSGELDFMYYQSSYPWDHLAGGLMVTEQGGVCRTMDGVAYSVLSPNKGLLVAVDALSWMTAQLTWPVKD
ncbi:MAG TPA: inositol monophosphatase [Arachnia sp.]|nr:inositol monophosphatase [Arachnia sp.]HMT86693.1 inositol monophosphatase [Arachnia sp.]